MQAMNVNPGEQKPRLENTKRKHTNIDKYAHPDAMTICLGGQEYQMPYIDMQYKATPLAQQIEEHR